MTTESKTKDAPGKFDVSIQIDCPVSGNVPSSFNVCGSYKLSFAPTVLVKCVLSYVDPLGIGQSPCKKCIVDTINQKWCCQFDLSPVPDAGINLTLSASLFNADGTMRLAPINQAIVTYQPGAQPNCTCDCSGAGDPCT
jgi:hypothetical protein